MERPRKVAITYENFGPEGIEERVLSSLGCEIKAADCSTEEEVIELARDADAILVLYAPISKRVIDTLAHCKVISRCGIGVDTIDVEAATAKGIWVCNVPDYCLDEVADHTLALLLCLTRGIVRYDRACKAGRWEIEAGGAIRRLGGRVLGLVGFGSIARNVAVRAQRFGFRVIAYDPYVDPVVAARLGVTLVRSLDEIATFSDAVSVHVPLNSETHQMIGASFFKRMKRGAVFINTARGRVVDTEALYQALVSGQIAGAGLDVLEGDPPGSHPIVALENVIVTPHVAFYSEESITELKERAAMAVVDVLSGRTPRNPVNAPQRRSEVLSSGEGEGQGTP